VALNGNDILMDIQVDQTTPTAVPCWWNLSVPPRNTQYAMGFAYTGTSGNCHDYWGDVPGGPSGGVAANLISPTRTRVHGVVAVDALAAAATTQPAVGDEVFSFSFTLKFGSAAGGTCTGCSTPACLSIPLIRVTQTNAPYYELTYPSTRNWITMNDGAAGGIPKTACPLDFLPTVNKTWGAIKTLYR
jgi:hypothetical protein